MKGRRWGNRTHRMQALRIVTVCSIAEDDTHGKVSKLHQAMFSLCNSRCPGVAEEKAWNELRIIVTLRVWWWIGQAGTGGDFMNDGPKSTWTN